jgi:hypothetical protein
MTISNVQLPNGTKTNATYRSDYSDAAYVRIAGTIVSGRVESENGQTVFRPRGKNAHLVQ